VNNEEQGAHLSILAADKSTRASRPNLFAVKIALGHSKNLPGSVGYSIPAANDREGTVKHETANGELMTMFAIRGR
jgi:hypothetical protein